MEREGEREIVQSECKSFEVELNDEKSGQNVDRGQSNSTGNLGSGRERAC